MANDPHSDFLQTYGGLAQDISDQTGLHPSVILGQIAQETGWGKHVQGNNVFGISPGGMVKNYPTVQDAATDYVSLINRRYADAAKAPTPETQAHALVAGGYNTADRNYAVNVSSNAHAIQARGANATLSDDDLDRALLTPAQPAAASPAEAAQPISDDALDDALLGKNAPDRGRPSTDFRYVAPYKAPDGATTTIAPEDYDRFNALIAYDREHPAPAPKPGTIDPVTHQPIQVAGTAAETPVTRFMDQGAPVSGASGVAASAIGSLPTDPAQRMRVLAAHFYPGMPINQAMTHVTPGPGGGVIVLGEDGRPVYEDPATPSLSSPTSLRPGNLLAYGASMAGPALPAVGGVAGSLAAAPTSLVAGPAFAAGGAAAGDLARQGMAKWFDPTPNATPIDLGQTAREAALAAGAQFVGAAGANILAPNTLRMTPRDLTSLRSNPLMHAAHDSYDRASAQGVQLTPGQATGLPSLLQYEDAAKTIPGTSDAAEAFYRRQGLQLSDAGQDMLGAISPNADKNAGATAFQQGSEDAIRLARQNANASARPAYEAAQNAGQVMSPDLAQLTDQPAIADALTAARRTYQNIYRMPAPETPDFALWDLAKRQLDDAHNVASRAGQRTDAMAIDGLRGDLVARLDDAYPSYATARTTAAPGQRLASQLEDSGVGTTAGKTGDERARAIVAPVFAQNNPVAISRARDAFVSSGRSDEWYAGVRAYIQDAFDKASMSQQGLNPAMLRRQVWGNTDNRDAIRAALTPAQYDGFDRFMQTVEETARTYPMNSLTATRQAAQNSLRSAAESQSNVKLIDAIGSAFSPASYANVGTKMLAGLRGRAVEGNVRSIVSSLFDPNGLRILEEMANYSPMSLKAGNLAAQILGRVVPPLAASTANPGTNPLQASPAAR